MKELNPELFQQSLEQEFEYRQIQDALDKMGPSSVKEFALEAFRQFQIKNKIVEELIKQDLLKGL